MKLKGRQATKGAFSHLQMEFVIPEESQENTWSGSSLMPARLADGLGPKSVLRFNSDSPRELVPPLRRLYLEKVLRRIRQKKFYFRVRKYSRGLEEDTYSLSARHLPDQNLA